MMTIPDLLKKYNVAAPRYTSYPTVPYWDLRTFNTKKWEASVKETHRLSKNEGISLYIHLPYCESLCTYCGCNKRITKNHGVEIPYINALLKEWAMYRNILGAKPIIRELHLGGGTPTFFSPQNLDLLLRNLLQDADLAQDAELSFEAHPANTTTEHLQTLYRLGFKRLSLGVQDFDAKVQLMINRFQTPKQVADITNEARAIGYHSINFDLIYGLPAQHLAGLRKTIASVITMQPDRIAFYSYAHVPWLKASQRRYTESDLPQGDEKFALYQTGRQLLMDAGYMDIGMDHFALKTDKLYQVSVTQQLHRNFMGYTSQHTQLLIGLGVSSISDSWTAFAQNAKTVEGYLEQINLNILPVEKGHILTDIDLNIRQHILNMMCNGYTQFEKIPTAVLDRLLPLVTDDLVQITDNEVRATDLGKSFLRNICMTFDERLWKKQPETRIFSVAI